MSRPVGGVLSRFAPWVVIHLCGLPENIERATRFQFDLAPSGVYKASTVTYTSGVLLPRRFTLACANAIGGLLSVALSFRSP